MLIPLELVAPVLPAGLPQGAHPHPGLHPARTRGGSSRGSSPPWPTARSSPTSAMTVYESLVGFAVAFVGDPGPGVRHCPVAPPVAPADAVPHRVEHDPVHRPGPVPGAVVRVRRDAADHHLGDRDLLPHAGHQHLRRRASRRSGWPSSWRSSARRGGSVSPTSSSPRPCR